MLGVFIAWIVFICLEQKTTLSFIKNMWKQRFFSVLTPFEDTKIFEFNQYQKSDETPSINHENVEPLIKKIDGFNSNSEK